MSLSKIYNLNKNNLLFSSNSIIKKYREDILSKFSESYFNKKNNESIKNFDLTLIDALRYNYEKSLLSDSVKINNSNYFDIRVFNGNCENFSNDKIQISFLDDKEEKSLFDAKDLSYNDLILDLNSLFTNSGFELIIKKNVKVIINIENIVSDQALTLFQKNLIKCEEGSELTLIENYKENSSFFHNVVSNFKLDKNAKLNHLIIQNNNLNKNLFVTTKSNLAQSSELKQSSFNFSKGFVRNHHYANLFEFNSSANFKGVFFLNGYNCADNKTFVTHKSESCKSDQSYKGVLTEKSKATYYSNTIVEKEAQKTEGYQLSKGILLSDDATFFSKPELRIYADDVKCSHGSTIGPINDDLIYYIRSRGLTKIEATKILIHSFVQDDILEIKDEDIKSQVLSHLDNYLNRIN